ncbi:MAG TPA: site-specific integrase [Terriglobales bacterium]|nr:site-specific integrase [Terriglobales bacterium]
MRKPKPSLYLRFRQPDGKQSSYCRAIFDGKSRLRPFWCLVRGTEEHHPEATYYQRTKRDGKGAWESLGTDPAAAWNKATVGKSVDTCKQELAAQRTQPEPTVTTDSYRINAEVKTYLSNVEKLAPKTHAAYKLTLDVFQESCSKIFVHQVAKQDLQAFDSFLLKQGHEDRTRANRIQHVVTFLRNKEGRRAGPPVTDVSIRIKYVEQPPEAYTRQELEDLFRVSSEDDRLLWRFFLGTGMREAEVSVGEYPDINAEKKTISIVEKPYFGFKPKDCEKRVVPIPDELIAQLSARKNGSSLIFGKHGQPDGHLIRRLKMVAFKGGLNCGKCQGIQNGRPVSCADAPVCEHWILHRFRKNFATDRHENGASARQIQKWLGHSSLETTLRYLATMDDTSEQVRDICNAAHAGLRL